MFSGIVKTTARIESIRSFEYGKSKKINFVLSQRLELLEGESVAVDGICLTAAKANKNAFEVDLSEETLEKTTAKIWKVGDEVNIESALRHSDPVGGHLVNGHVDGVGVIVEKKEKGEFIELDLSLSPALVKYLIPKGSIAINGVSLTVNSICDNKVSLMLIPHTLYKTNLKNKKSGDNVNVEIDMMAKYVYYFLREEHEYQH